jgi:hypothetical protein
MEPVARRGTRPVTDQSAQADFVWLLPRIHSLVPGLNLPPSRSIDRMPLLRLLSRSAPPAGHTPSAPALGAIREAGGKVTDFVVVAGAP